MLVTRVELATNLKDKREMESETMSEKAQTMLRHVQAQCSLHRDKIHGTE